MVEPGIVERTDDGIWMDLDHPVWRQAAAKYSSPGPLGGCSGCGGAKYNPADFNRPGGADELLRQLG